MGESKLKQAKHEGTLMTCAGVQTVAGRVQVRWESKSAATPMGQLAYFIEFLTLTGLWLRWQESCPLSYTSPNAPSKADVLGTWMLSVSNSAHDDTFFYHFVRHEMARHARMYRCFGDISCDKRSID